MEETDQLKPYSLPNVHQAGKILQRILKHPMHEKNAEPLHKIFL